MRNLTELYRSSPRQAEKYDASARVQQRVHERFLIAHMEDCGAPGSILDIGAGTGALLDSLASRYPGALLAGVDLAQGMARRALQRFTGSGNPFFVCGDGEALPFKANSFALVVSTSTFQWLYPFNKAFAEAWRVLEPGSRFCFALFGEKTLYELRDSYKRALASEGGTALDRSHVFASEEEVLQSLVEAGFKDCSVASELEVEVHADVPALLRSLKNIGAGNAAAMPGRGLSGRKIM